MIHRDLHQPGRSVTYVTNGLAASSHPLASQAAIDVLKQGGNAIDAAIAASAVLCVVEPMSTGLGGDCFVLYSPGNSSEIIGLNGSGRATSAASLNWFLDQNISEIDINSVHSITVPGALDAWIRLLEDHGTMELGEIFSPAIRYADDGFPVSPRVALDWAAGESRLQMHAGSQGVYLPGGRAPQAGEVFKSPALAGTLRTIAREGRDAFYEGPLAETMIRFLRAQGSLLSAQDFANNRPDYVTPLRTSYKGYELVELPPNGQGVTALMMMNILSGFDLENLDPLGAERFHLEAEASRLVFQARDQFVADSQFSDVPIDHLLSARFTEELCARIDPGRAMTDVTPMEGPVYRDTVYLTVVDRDLNAVSFINSIYFGFGSAYVCPETGVCFQNRGAGFRIEEGHPNCIAGGKRPMHTIIPAMLTKEGKAVCSFGVMGGAYQPVGHVHVATNLIDYGMDVQAALDCPRGFHLGGGYGLERGVPSATAGALQNMGHEIHTPDRPLGGGQAIWIDHEKGVLAGGSDPRKDGAAIGW